MSDLNEDLINVYRSTRDIVDLFISQLKAHKTTEEYFYAVRKWDRPGPDGSVRLATLTEVERAARFMLLNKLSFNGLVRFNKAGEFNAPFGHYKRPNICNEEAILAASAVLQNVNVQHVDFETAVSTAVAGDFVFFDPPYVPLSKSSSFTAYNGDGFGEDEQRRLARVFTELDRRGVQAMLANSNTPLVRELYGRYRIVEVTARRNINSKGTKRGAIKEVVVVNY